MASPTTVKNVIHVYTDGSVSKNGSKHATGGIGVFFGDGDRRNTSAPFVLSPITTPRTELFAVLQAIDIVMRDTSINHVNTALHIHSDSTYVVKIAMQWRKQWQERGWLTLKKKPIKNIDLVKVLHAQMENGVLEIVVLHCKAHCGIAGNEAADRLAVQGRKRGNSMRNQEP